MTKNSASVLQVRHEGGAHWLRVPADAIPGSAKSKVFFLAPDAELRDLFEDVRTEVPELADQELKVVSASGVDIPEKSLVWNLVKQTGLTAQIGASSFQIDSEAAPVSVHSGRSIGGKICSEYSAEEIEIVGADNERRNNIIRIRKLLEDDPRQQISVSEFHTLCSNNSLMQRENQDELLRNLDAAGVVTFQQQSQVIYLHPDEMEREVYHELGFMTPYQNSIFCKQAQARENLDLLRHDLAALQSQKTKLDLKIARSNAIFRVLGLGGLMGGVSFYWYLSYVLFSWDIMEPVTYFTGTFFSIVGYLWYFGTSTPYEYDNMHALAISNAQRKRYAREGFPIAEMNELETKLQEQEDLVKTLTQSMKH